MIFLELFLEEKPFMNFPFFYSAPFKRNRVRWTEVLLLYVTNTMQSLCQYPLVFEIDELFAVIFMPVPG
jgi:hypothetical protein